MRQSCGGVAALLLALLVSCACTLLPSPQVALAGEATAVGRLGLFQEYRVPVSGLENRFDYEIVPDEEDAPLPVDESGVAREYVSLKRDQQIWLEFPVQAQIGSPTQQLVYHYRLQPKRTELPDGLYYVDMLSPNLKAGVNVYYLELYVQLSSEGTTTVTPIVHVEGWDGPKVTDPGWRVAYKKSEEGDKPEDDNRPGGVLSKTGDTYDPMLVASYATSGAMLVLAGALLCRTKAGERNA